MRLPSARHTGHTRWAYLSLPKTLGAFFACVALTLALLLRAEMAEQSAFDKVEAEIVAVSAALQKVEAQIEEARAAGDKDEVAALREKEKQLRHEKEQLCKKEEQLREIQILTLQRQPGAVEL